MSDFDFFLSFFGVLLGLIVAEVTIEFADAIDRHSHRPIGLLSPLPAIFVLMDITSLWLWAWGARESGLKATAVSTTTPTPPR